MILGWYTRMCLCSLETSLGLPCLLGLFPPAVSWELWGAHLCVLVSIQEHVIPALNCVFLSMLFQPWTVCFYPCYFSPELWLWGSDDLVCTFPMVSTGEQPRPPTESLPTKILQCSFFMVQFSGHSYFFLSWQKLFKEERKKGFILQGR